MGDELRPWRMVLLPPVHFLLVNVLLLLFLLSC